MGFLRLVLAISVAIGHSTPIGPIRGIEPAIAVEAFYIISGFYMSLVLSGKYRTTRNSALLFYTNRYLRLVPTYWVLLTLALVARVALGGHHVTTFKLLVALPALERAWVFFTNASLLGLDSLMFVGIRDLSNPHLSFSPFIGSLPFAGASFVILPPAWSLGVELTFYIVAPFLAHLRSRWLMVLLLASLSLRLLVYKMGYDRDPWTYRFFPFELACFLVGMLAQRTYALRREWIAPRSRAVVVFFSIFTSICLMAAPYRWIGLSFLVAVAGSLPFIFAMTSRSKTDARVAELSYPVYLTHFFFVPFAKIGLFVCILSILASVGLILLVERPVAAYRERRVERFKLAAAARASAPAAPR